MPHPPLAPPDTWFAREVSKAGRPRRAEAPPRTRSRLATPSAHKGVGDRGDGPDVRPHRGPLLEPHRGTAVADAGALRPNAGHTSCVAKNTFHLLAALPCALFSTAPIFALQCYRISREPPRRLCRAGPQHPADHQAYQRLAAGGRLAERFAFQSDERFPSPSPARYFHALASNPGRCWARLSPRLD